MHACMEIILTAQSVLDNVLGLPPEIYMLLETEALYAFARCAWLGGAVGRYSGLETGEI
jgi:hypothetical protein